MPERRLRAAELAGLVILDRLVGGLQHARRLDAEALVQRVLERLHALVEHVEIDARHLRAEADRGADPGRDRREVGGALGHGIGDKAAEADVVAADRHQHDVDRALALVGRAPVHGDALRRDRGAAGGVHRQRIGRLLARIAAAEQIGELIELRADLLAVRLAEALARIHLKEQAVGNLGAGAGEGRERDRAVAVLQRELEADAHRIAVLRAVAVVAQPLRLRTVEGGAEFRRRQPQEALGELVFHQPARQHLRIDLRIARRQPETPSPCGISCCGPCATSSCSRVGS